MWRRDFIALLCGMAVWPTGAAAQQPGRIILIGTLDNGTLATRKHLWDAFKERMRALGYTEGRDIAYEARWADGVADRHPTLASELIALNVDVIVAASTSAVRAAAAATRTIPIVTASSSPLLAGAENLPKPGGNVTGVTTISRQLLGLRLQLLKEAMPALSRAGVLGDQGSESSRLQFSEIEAPARALGISVEPIALRASDEIPAAFARFAAQRVDAVILLASSLLFNQRDRVSELALQYRLPTIASQREYTEAGCLMSYGANLVEGFRRAADYVDKILKGARPGDLPVEQPARFALVVNLKTAKALGIDFPSPFLARVDQVIE